MEKEEDWTLEIVGSGWTVQRRNLCHRSFPEQLDLGNLLVNDSRVPPRGENERVAHSASSVQLLINRLFERDGEVVPFGKIVPLEPPKLRIPREKPIPSKKKETKWEKFAKERGIVKRKRSKLEWDESGGEWKRRHGYKRANDETNMWLMEDKPGLEGENPFVAKKKEKKERVKEQKKRERMNSRKRGADSLSMEAMEPRSKKQRKDAVTAAFNNAKKSTASVGKFDKQFRNEPKEKKGRTKTQPNEVNVAAEKKGYMNVLDRVLSKSGDKEGNVNVKKVVNREVSKQHKKKRK